MLIGTGAVCKGPGGGCDDSGTGGMIYFALSSAFNELFDFKRAEATGTAIAFSVDQARGQVVSCSAVSILMRISRNPWNMVRHVETSMLLGSGVLVPTNNAKKL